MILETVGGSQDLLKCAHIEKLDMNNRTLLLIILFSLVIVCGCTESEKRRLRSYLPIKGDTYKYCTYTSKNQEKHWGDLEKDEMDVYETVTTVFITSESFYPDERIIESKSFTSHKKEPIVFQTKMKLENNKIDIKSDLNPDGTTILQLPIKLNTKWNVKGWQISGITGETETFKIKCEITSLGNEIILGKYIDMIEVTCHSGKEGFGETKYKIARNFGIVQRIMEDGKGVVWMKEELCPDQALPQ